MTTISAFDPFADEVLADPFPYYAWLREEHPAYHCEPRDCYVLTRYDDVRAALRNEAVFSSGQGVGYEVRPVPMMISMDPPDHTRLRRIFSRRFTPRAILRWEETIGRICDDLVDEALEQGEMDWSKVVAYPLPVTVIADMMGVPKDRFDDFKRWSDATIDALGGGLDYQEKREEVERTILEFAGFFADFIEQRKRELAGGAPAEDLVSLLIEREEDEVLDDFELVSFCVLLLVAGNETTTNMIGNTVLRFLEQPEQWQLLRENRDLVEPCIEESLRFEAPIQGFFRNTLSQVELHGVTIPQDKKVMCYYGAANRDPRRFPDPDRFDVTRRPEEHLAFGSGIHLCMGAPLARLEGRLLLERLLDRVERFEPLADPVRTRNPLLRGVASLPLRVISD